MKHTKIQDTRILIELLNPEEIMRMTLTRALTKRLSNVQSEIRLKIIDRMLIIFDADSLKNIQAEVYSKHYTHDEIRDMLKFYKSETGKKILKVGPDLIIDLMRVIDVWSGEELKKNDPKIMQIVKETLDEYNVTHLEKKDVVFTKQEFALNYAMNKGWGDDLTKLTIEQMAEIMACKEWEGLP
jgi:hypothetical protein